MPSAMPKWTIIVPKYDKVAHLLARLLDRDALLGPQPRILDRELLAEHGIGRVDAPGAGEVDAEAAGSLVHDVLGREQDEVGDVAPQQHHGRLEDPVLRTLRQHDRALVGACPLHELVLEHQWRTDVGMGHVHRRDERAGVDVVAEDAARDSRSCAPSRSPSPRGRTTAPRSCTCRPAWSR